MFAAAGQQNGEKRHSLALLLRFSFSAESHRSLILHSRCVAFMALAFAAQPPISFSFPICPSFIIIIADRLVGYNVSFAVVVDVATAIFNGVRRPILSFVPTCHTLVSSLADPVPFWLHRTAVVHFRNGGTDTPPLNTSIPQSLRRSV